MYILGPDIPNYNSQHTQGQYSNHSGMRIFSVNNLSGALNMKPIMVQGLTCFGVYLKHLRGEELFLRRICVYPND